MPKGTSAAPTALVVVPARQPFSSASRVDGHWQPLEVLERHRDEEEQEVACVFEVTDETEETRSVHGSGVEPRTVKAAQVGLKTIKARTTKSGSPAAKASIEEIAARSDFGATTTFRAHFRRVVGVSRQANRLSFGGPAPRRRS